MSIGSFFIFLFFYFFMKKFLSILIILMLLGIGFSESAKIVSVGQTIQKEKNNSYKEKVESNKKIKSVYEEKYVTKNNAAVSILKVNNKINYIKIKRKGINITLNKSSNKMSIFINKIVLRVSINETLNLSVKNNSEEIYAKVNDKELKIESLKLKFNATLKEAQLMVKNETPVYRIKVQRKAKILGIFPVEYEESSEINATNNEVIKEEKPWFSFLLFE